MEIIADIHNDYDSKFGVPRQPGLVEDAVSTIVFRKEYRISEALRGLEEFDYIWLLWEFSECKGKPWSPTVRPPRLGGNTRKGVFATRSPFRPNSIGLSCVKIKSIEKTDDCGMVIKVTGADLMNGTPIYDIKPYLPYVDSHPEASNGFAQSDREKLLDVETAEGIELPAEKEKAIREILAQDPRPQYIEDESRIFGITYGGYNIRFTVKENALTVIEVKETEK